MTLFKEGLTSESSMLLSSREATDTPSTAGGWSLLRPALLLAFLEAEAFAFCSKLKKKETVQKTQSVLRIHVEPLNRSDQDGHKLSYKQKIPLNEKKLNPLWELWYWNKKPNSRNQESNAQTQAKQYMYIIIS